MSQSTKRLPKEFYQQETIEVAQSLLGKVLVHTTPQGEHYRGQIVETEAYLGADDPACHSFGHRRTPRTNTMFLPGGHAYVYFIYGMYFCFNVVTRSPDEPEAVLIRAVEPLEGLPSMTRNRQGKKGRELTSGPGKLCQAFEINKKIDGLCLVQSQIQICESETNIASTIAEGPRIGIDSTGDAALWPLRFYLVGNQFVSKGPSPY